MCSYITTRYFFALPVFVGNISGFILKNTFLHLMDSTVVVKYNITDAHIGFEVLLTTSGQILLSKEPH